MDSESFFEGTPTCSGQSKAAAASNGETSDDAMEDEEDEALREALRLYKKNDARLRRLCERKPTGRLQVPAVVHEQWKKGGTDRDELRVLLEKSDFQKDRYLFCQCCILYMCFFFYQGSKTYCLIPSHFLFEIFPQDVFLNQAIKIIERKKEDTHTIRSGWFTPEGMKTELKWTGTLILEKDVRYKTRLSMVMCLSFTTKDYICNMFDCGLLERKCMDRCSFSMAKALHQRCDLVLQKAWPREDTGAARTCSQQWPTY